MRDTRSPVWRMRHPAATRETLGFIPGFLSKDDPRPAAQQFNDAYIGGWSPSPKFAMLPDGGLKYPGEGPLLLLAETRLRDEVIRFYRGAWVSIHQPDGSFEIARMD